jgi:acyl carrier protein
MLEQIKTILAAHGKLSVDAHSLSDTSDLYESGLTSLTTVNIMLALEDAFNVEFTDDMLSRKTFQSIASLRYAIEELLDQ